MVQNACVVIQQLNKDIPPETAQPLAILEHGSGAVGSLISRLERPHLHVCNGSDQAYRNTSGKAGNGNAPVAQRGQACRSQVGSCFAAEPDARRGYCRSMPRVSAFYGVAIYMYWNERDHPVAHFHAYHAGRRASVSADGEVLAGGLDPRALQFVREWAVLRHGEILANWERARRNEPLLGIDPLA